MTEIKNEQKNILIISEDNTILEYTKDIFRNYNIIYYQDSFKEFDKVNLIILDDYTFENKLTLEDILSNRHILNISSNKYQNMITLNRPFSLKDLFSIIESVFINFKKILKFKNFEINKSILVSNEKEIIFGNKEISLITYLYNNKESEKLELLEKIWNYNEEIQTQVLENTINKIRKKLKSDFIIYKEGKYSINNKYL